MKYFTLTYILIVAWCFLPAQHELTGTFTSTEDQPIQFARVAAYLQDSIQSQTLTDDQGSFSLHLPKNEYLIKVEWLNRIIYEESLTIEDYTNLGTLTIDNATQIDEVEIQAQKRQITRNGDKLIMNVLDNPRFEGKMAAEILSYAPYVWFDQSSRTFSIKGNATVILINGKRSNLAPEDLNNYLNSLSQKEIKAIEIVSNPSSRYDAEGAGGVINIVTSRAQERGIYGSLYSGLHLGPFVSHSHSAQVNAKINDKLSLNTYFAFVRQNGRQTEDRTETLRSPAVVYDYRKEDTTRQRYGFANMSLSYEPSKKSEINLGYSGYFSNSQRDQYNDLTITQEDDIMSIGIYDYLNTSQTHDVSLNYNQDLDDKGQKLSFLTDYYRANYLADNLYENRFFSPVEQLINDNLRKSFSPTTNDILSSQLDYVLPTRKGYIEAGIKYSSVWNGNETFFQNLIDGEFVSDPILTNAYEYREQIGAAYMSAAWDSIFSSGFSLQTGLRAEWTKGDGLIPTNGTEIKREYTNLFPSIFLSRNLKKNQTLNLSYSKRINRPNYNSFNPTIFYLTDFTSQVGNPNLNPSFTHAWEMGFNRQNFNVIAYYNDTRGEAREILTRLSEETLQYNWRNLDHARIAGLSVSVTPKITKWWELQVRGNLYHKQYQSTFEDVNDIDVGMTTFQGRIGTSFTLPHNTRAEASFEYNGREIYGQYGSGANYATYLNLSKSFGSKMTIYIQAVDIFNQLRYEFFNDQQEITTTQFRNPYRRSISIMAVYNFQRGKQTKNNNIKKSNQDLQNRARS
ncbi:MAG: outer membrane beta-barrel protein [Bacteroidota bacterium]